MLSFNRFKIFRILIKTAFVISLLFLTACAKPIMPPIEYDKPIQTHIKKDAVVNWDFGKQHDSSLPNYGQINGGLVETLVTTTVNSIDRANNPSKYTLSYGKAEQTIFMTSFRDVLNKNQVFKKVELASDANEPAGKDVLIDLFFKNSRVSTAERNFRITLTVDMTIKSQGKAPFKRTYLVQSNAGGGSFQQQQVKVSKVLLEKLISGIEEWSNPVTTGVNKS